jgi:pyrimidine-nucleoside phosphorylase
MLMRAVDIIRKKRDGHCLAADEIEAFVQAATHGHWPDYQLAALLMAIVWRGMSAEETAQLTRCMVASGVRLEWADLPGPTADKHSTGGVGDKTSLLIAPLAAACGVYVPMMSGRGLGHTGGTLDKLESIPGLRVGLSLTEFRAIVERVGCAMISQTQQIAPADRVLYALRDVTATVESIPLITASILSKKIAEGIAALVLDVKVGRGAFMKTLADARQLAQSIVQNGQANGVRTEAVLTDMDVPLGLAVGNALEVSECIAALRGHGPPDLVELSLELTARMLVLAGEASDRATARAKAERALASGQALEKFGQLIEAQGGDRRVVDDPARLPQAKYTQTLHAEQAGVLCQMDAEQIGRAAMLLGAGRDRVDDAVDPAVGIVLGVKPGATVGVGDALAHIYYNQPERLRQATDLLRQAIVVAEQYQPSALVLETVGG